MNSRLGFALGVLIVAACHFCLTFMLGFITGTTQGGNRPLVVLTQILTFPMSVMKGSDDTHPVIGWGLWGAISLAWGLAICSSLRALSKKSLSQR